VNAAQPGITCVGALTSQLRVQGGTTGSDIFSLGAPGALKIDYPGESGGRLTINDAGDMTLGRGLLLASNTTDSTSSTTGCATFAGGVGITKKLFVGGSLDIGSTSTGQQHSMKTNNVGDVLSLQNLNSSGFSTIDFNDISGTTKLYIGFGNSASNRPLAGYIVGSGLTNINLEGTIYKVTDTTASTSTSTGSFIVSGGVGIAGALYVGGVGNVGSLVSTGTGSFVGILSVTNTTQSSSVTTGSTIISGGLGIAKDVYIGGNLTITGTVTVPTPVNATDASTKAYVDSLISTAGTGLTKTGNVFSVNASQTQITSLGTLTGLTVSGSSLVTNTTVSTSTSTGAFIVSGGVGIAKGLFVGGSLDIGSTSTGQHVIKSNYAGDLILVQNLNSSAYSAIDFADNTGTNRLFLGFGNSASARPLAGYLAASGLSYVNLEGTKFIVTDGTDSSSTTTGSFQVTGGVGISKKLFVGGNLNILNADDTYGSDLTAASAVFAGGIAVSKRLLCQSFHCIGTIRGVNYQSGDSGWVTSLRRTGISIGYTESIKYFTQTGQLTTFIWEFSVNSVSGSPSGSMSFYIPYSVPLVSRTYNNPEVLFYYNGTIDTTYSITITASNQTATIKQSGADVTLPTGTYYIKMTYV
jgi:hypothetical protein